MHWEMVYLYNILLGPSMVPILGLVCGMLKGSQVAGSGCFGFLGSRSDKNLFRVRIPLSNILAFLLGFNPEMSGGV